MRCLFRTLIILPALAALALVLALHSFETFSSSAFPETESSTVTSLSPNHFKPKFKLRPIKPNQIAPAPSPTTTTPTTTPPQKQHIVMIGDSLTRYRYMEMVYFRHYSKYAPREVISWRKGDWNKFYKSTESVFGGYMSCDCFRGRTTGDNYARVTANRY